MEPRRSRPDAGAAHGLHEPGVVPDPLPPGLERQPISAPLSAGRVRCGIREVPELVPEQSEDVRTRQLERARGEVDPRRIQVRER